MSVARFRHVAMPQLGRVTARSLRGVNGLAALREMLFYGSTLNGHEAGNGGYSQEETYGRASLSRSGGCDREV